MQNQRLAALVAAAGLIFLAAAVPAQEPDYRLQEVREGLYRFTAGNYRSMVWVADDGIAVLDTLNVAAATWLRDELKARFGLPVRYVVYSHNHFDHAYGGRVFDSAQTTFVAHEDAYQDLLRTRADTALPDLTFVDTARIRLGDEVLTLRYHGANNGRGSVSMHFEEARLLYVVDWVVVGRMPYMDLKGYDIDGMISSTRDVLALDWDVFVGGHAEVGDRAGVERYLDYLETLYAGVRDGMIAGKSLASLKAEITLEEFEDLPMFEQWRAQNIEGVFRTLEDRSYMLMRPGISEVQGEH